MEKLEGMRDGVEKRWQQKNSSGELHELVQRLLIQERIGPTEEVKSLQIALANKLHERDQERDEYRVKWDSLCKEIEKFSTPEIAQGLAKIQHEISTLKLLEVILERRSGGYDMKAKLKLSTNRDAILTAKRIGASATEKFHTMRHESVEKIKDFIVEQLQKIQAIDFTPKEKMVDEFAHERAGWIASPVR